MGMKRLRLVRMVLVLGACAFFVGSLSGCDDDRFWDQWRKFWPDGVVIE